MKFTLSWLKDFLETDADLEKISHTLTSIGLEVEKITDISEALRPFTVAEILSTEKHPNADKLQICKVRTFKDERVIVCGATNARAGIKVILADIGVIIPDGDFKIKKSKIRGIESSGMLCAASELGISDESSGIMELPNNAKIGESIVDILNLNDPLIEIAITPNRGDCLGIYGIARDLAAAGIGTLKKQDFSPIYSTIKTTKNIEISSNYCSSFSGRIIKNVKNCESPEWLKKRLKSIGQKSISALVDISNYIMFSYNRPNHIYDDDKLSGDIKILDIKNSIKFKALNENEYELPTETCVITDDNKTIAIAGIIGGMDSATDANTTNIFLESANFDANSIAKTGRNLRIESDARYRFERLSDPDFIDIGAEITTRLILEICGGEAGELITQKIAPLAPVTIKFNPNFTKKLGGMNISDKQQYNILKNLGFLIDNSNDEWLITPPSYRQDIHGKADLVEEILRITGYDNILEITLPHKIPEKNPDSVGIQKIIRNSLVNSGMHETYHFSFIKQNVAEIFSVGDTEIVEIENPISSDMNAMRTSLLPNLLQSLSKNIAKGAKDLSFFEIGNIFNGTEITKQPTVVTGIKYGKTPLNWAENTRKLDVFDIKSSLFIALQSIGVNTKKLTIDRNVPTYFHPSKSGRIGLGAKITLGYFGEIHPKINRLFNIDDAAMGFELYPENIPNKKKSIKKKAIKISEYQSVRRDFAFIIDENLSATKLLSTIKNADKNLIQNIIIFDIYQGKGIAENKKSLAIAVILRSLNKTLTENDIKLISGKIISSASKLGATLR